jgi:hypothetical protein
MDHITSIANAYIVRSQTKDSKKAKVEQDEFGKELSKWEVIDRLLAPGMF